MIGEREMVTRTLAEKYRDSEKGETLILEKGKEEH